MQTSIMASWKVRQMVEKAAKQAEAQRQDDYGSRYFYGTCEHRMDGMCLRCTYRETQECDERIPDRR